MNDVFEIAAAKFFLDGGCARNQKCCVSLFGDGIGERFCGDVGYILRDDEPGIALRDLCRLRRPASIEHSLLRAGGRLRGIRVFEALLAKEAEPRFAGEERIVGTKSSVLEAPPAFGKPESEIDPGFGARAFDENEERAGSHELADVRESFGQVGGGVKNVGGDDDVEMMEREILGGRVLFDIEDAIFEIRVAGEFFLGGGDKGRRDVGVEILGAIGGEKRREVSGGATGAGADFEDMERAVGAAGNFVVDDFGGEAVENFGCGRVSVDFFGGFGGAAWEEQRERVEFALQDFGEGRGAAGGEFQLGGKFGKFASEGLHLGSRDRLRRRRCLHREPARRERRAGG